MTHRATSFGPPETVVVVEEEVVLRGGAGTVSWLVRHNDAWVRSTSHASARLEQLERGAGIVWRRRVTLELPRGTQLCRVESRPEPRKKSALEHLTGAARGAPRRTTRKEYVVLAGGELERVGDK